ERVETLWRHTRHFKMRMTELGFDIGKSESPITPVMVGEAEVAKKLSARLFEEGVFALPIVFPMVAKGRARIRTIMNAALTNEDREFAIGAFEKIGKALAIVARH